MREERRDGRRRGRRGRRKETRPILQKTGNRGFQFISNLVTNATASELIRVGRRDVKVDVRGKEEDRIFNHKGA